MRIILFTGKGGGVGKTTIAAATAIRLADRGVKTVLLSTDAAHSLADALSCPLGGEPAEVHPSLWAAQIDTQRRFEVAWRDLQRYLIDILARGGRRRDRGGGAHRPPGRRGGLGPARGPRSAASGQWDAVVVDCAPTAETLRLLALPEALGGYLQKVFPTHRRLARGMRPLAVFLGRSEAIPSDGVFQALLQLADELESIRAMLADPTLTTVRLVLTPEAVVTAEARRTFTALALYGYSVDLIIANRVFPAGRDAFRSAWTAAQRRQLEVVRQSFAGLPVREVAYRPDEPIGTEALRVVASALYGDLPGEDPVDYGPPSELMSVDADGDGYLLRMWLPLVAETSVDAARAGDDLIVTVGPHRRVLTLPSGLRRCEIVGGEFVNRELRIRFRPDPAVWRRT